MQQTDDELNATEEETGMQRRGLLHRWRRRPSAGAGAPVTAANALTAAWARTHDDGNTVLAGVGVWVLLAMLASVACGRARSELEAAADVTADEALDAALDLVRTLEAIEAVHVAVGLWSKIALDPGWVGELPSTVVGELTGDPDADHQRLDAWVAEATDHVLHRLPIAIGRDTLLVLASALTVRTEWVTPFDEGSTTGGAWADRPVSWLTQTTGDLDVLRVARTDLGPIALLRVPGGDDIDVHLVRGPATAGAGEVLAAGIEGLDDPDTTRGAALPVGFEGPGVHVERVTSLAGDVLVVDVPAFAVRASHDLLRHKPVFGLTAATDSSTGHFPGMAAEPLAVGRAAQDATAEFSRTGFRAAAITAVEIMPGSAPGPSPEPQHARRVTVAFDEPFGFVAVHAPTSLVLAAGWVDDPSTAEASRPAPGGP